MNVEFSVSKVVMNLEFPIEKHCRLCDTSAIIVFEDSRTFYLCKSCGLIFSDCTYLPEKIKEHYQCQYSNFFDWAGEAKAVLEIVSFVVKPRKILTMVQVQDSWLTHSDPWDLK